MGLFVMVGWVGRVIVWVGGVGCGVVGVWGGWSRELEG